MLGTIYYKLCCVRKRSSLGSNCFTLPSIHSPIRPLIDLHPASNLRLCTDFYLLSIYQSIYQPIYLPIYELNFCDSPSSHEAKKHVYLSLASNNPQAISLLSIFLTLSILLSLSPSFYFFLFFYFLFFYLLHLFFGSPI